jgi:protein TonB
VVEAHTTESASKPPNLLESDAPLFPEEARKAGSGAHVIVKLLVKTDGTADSVTVDVKSKSHGEEFEKAIRDAVENWRFEPGENEDGEPVPAWVKVKVQFELDNCDDAEKKKKTAKTTSTPKSESND